MSVETIQNGTVMIYIMNKKHSVPSSLTIMKAMEYVGHRLIRGSGCRGGFCGACATVYRLENDYKLKVALACQKTVEEGMHIAQIPFTPDNKQLYDLESISLTTNVFLEFYPEIAKCLSCNTCTKACPQDLEVLDYVQAALRGDFKEAASLSFDCLSCNLCAIRCPAEIVPSNIATLARRIFGKYVTPKAKHVEARIKEVENGDFNEDIDRFMGLQLNILKEKYENREIEPE